MNSLLLESHRIRHVHVYALFVGHCQIYVVSSTSLTTRRIYMSRKLFTEEQMASLRQNPYVYSVSSTVLVLRKSFKEIFYKEYMEGAYPKAILKKYGFDTTMLGKNRIDSIAYHIKKEYAKYGGFYEGRRPANRHETACATEQTTEEELKSLRHEVEYLRQEVDFLKKISVIRKPRK